VVLQKYELLSLLVNVADMCTADVSPVNVQCCSSVLGSIK